MLTLTQKIFIALKKGHRLTAQQVADATGEPLARVLKCLRTYVEKGHIARDKDGFFYIPIVLNPFPPFVKQDYVFESLPVRTYPEEFHNDDYKKIVHRWQDLRGTCGGQSGAAWADLNYGELTGDWPTEQDKLALQRDYIDGKGVRRDILYPTSFSAECIYQWSREIANLTWGEGTYIWAVMRALHERGVCTESTWPTGKDPGAVYTQTPPGAWTQAARHKIEGYAKITTWDGFCRAIAEHRKVYLGMAVWENYRDCIPTGIWPDKKGNLVGGHAVTPVGYGPSYFEFLNSWEPVPILNVASKQYWEDSLATGGHECYAVIDAAEVEILRKLYRTVQVIADVPASIVIDRSPVGDTDRGVQASLRCGETLLFEAREIHGEKTLTKEVLIAEPCGTDPQVVEFTFYEEGEPKPEPETWWQWLIRWIQDWIRRHFGGRGGVLPHVTKRNTCT